jgi:hypothetical protein
VVFGCVGDCDHNTEVILVSTSDVLQTVISLIFEMAKEALDFLNSIELAPGVSALSVAICAIILPLVISTVLAQVNVKGRIDLKPARDKGRKGGNE